MITMDLRSLRARLFIFFEYDEPLVDPTEVTAN